MAIRPFNFYVEMEKNDYTPVGEVKQLDTMELDIKVLENSIPKNLESSEISLYVRKKDGTILEQKENISIVEASEGTIKIKVKNQATACAGMTLFELELKGADGIATTGTFIFVVNERVVNGEVVESKDEIHALVEVEKYVKLAKEELQRFKELQAEMLRTNETMNSQENLRNVAETERISAEEERKEKESERVESESNRVTAEGLRANAESSRANAENSRERKERERVTAEVSRVDAEALRVSEEKKRVNAENSRANAERSRIDAESVRVAEEKKRVTAETARAENEDARVLAEQNREENFSQFESKINKISSDMSKNTKELKNARTATTGEQFDSLDERIDCEVDRLNKKIEVSFLQQEDKGKHVIENTVDGMTTDMVIKGRTLFNHVGKYLKHAGCDWDDNKVTVSGISLNDGYSINFEGTAIDINKSYILGIYIESLNDNAKNLGFSMGVLDNTGSAWNKVESITPVKGWNFVELAFDKSKTLGNIRFRNSKPPTDLELNIVFTNFIMIEKINKYSFIDNPCYFKDFKSFGQQEDKISILSHGKNLWNKELFVPKLLDENSWDSSGAYRNNIQKIYLQKGEYKITTPELVVPPRLYPILLIKDNEEVVGQLLQSGTYNNSDSDSPKTVASQRFNMTVKNDGYYFLNAYFDGGFSQSNLDKHRTLLESDFQIEESTIGTSYEPYKQDKKDILLQDLGFDEGLRGLNNSVYDELNSIRDVAVKKVGKYTFTGNENWQTLRDEMFVKTIQFYLDTSSFMNNNSHLLCNTFPFELTRINEDREGISKIGGNGLNVWINIDRSKLTTQNVEGFKAWLKANPTTIYYELAQPVETPLDENIALKTFGEKTYVSFENAISGTSSFKAPVNTVLALSNLTDDIKNKTDKKEADEINERATESLELSEYNHSDINDNIFPYIMDLELMVLDMMELNGYTNKKYKISERAGIHMTSKQALERLIRQKKVTLEDALDRIVRYNDAGRITDAEALELTDLAHEIL